MKRATVKQQAEAYAKSVYPPSSWSRIEFCDVCAAFEAGYRAAQRAARKAKKGAKK